MIKRKKNHINFSLIYCFFIWRNLNPPHKRMLFAKIGWNWLNGSEKEFFNFVNAFSLFYNYFPLEKGGALHLNKFESPSPKNALCQVCLKLAQWFWRIRFLKVVNLFIISQLSPLWEERGPSFEQMWIPFTQGYFVPSLFEIGPVVLEKKMKMWKVYRQTDGRTKMSV